MINTFISATLGSVVSNAMTRGIAGAQTPIDWTAATIGGLQTGTAFIAYPVAVHALADCCPEYKKAVEDPKGNKALVYIGGGALGAAICTVINYPLSLALKKHNGVKCEKGGCCVKNLAKGLASFYVDQVPSSIGFAATMGTVAPMIPVPKNSLLKWARDTGLVQISNVGGKLLAYPVHRLRHGATLTGMLGGYLKGAHGVVFTGDATNHFKNVFGFIQQ